MIAQKWRQRRAGLRYPARDPLPAGFAGRAHRKGDEQVSVRREREVENPRRHLEVRHLLDGGSVPELDLAGAAKRAHPMAVRRHGDAINGVRRPSHGHAHPQAPPRRHMVEREIRSSGPAGHDAAVRRQRGLLKIPAEIDVPQLPAGVEIPRM